jgi:hypothetical protein
MHHDDWAIFSGGFTAHELLLQDDIAICTAQLLVHIKCMHVE